MVGDSVSSAICNDYSNIVAQIALIIIQASLLALNKFIDKKNKEKNIE